MTVTASIILSQNAARHLADAISESSRLYERSFDLNEIDPENWRLVVYFDDTPVEEDVTELRVLAKQAGASSGDDFEIEELPDLDWVAKSLEGLAPVRAGRFVVHGSHDRDILRANDIGIEIEAGLAFGTGHHGTTAGCLMAIDRLANERPVRNVLDLGTGSGVLAIGVAKRTKARVIASDIDPVAVNVAADNVRLNGEAARIRTVVAAGMENTTIGEFAPYDLIVANILAGPLVTLAPALRRHIAPGGTIILSGLLEEQQRRVTAAYRAQELRFISADVIDGWVTLVMRR